jgi:hypothetical protein
MDAADYVWVGAALWLAIAVSLSLLVGRIIRGRDAQVPVPPVHDSNSASSPPSERSTSA